MTRAEQKVNSIKKEIEKINASIARCEKRVAKKTAEAEKVDANWTRDQHFELREAGKTTDEQEWAWFDKYCAESELEDYRQRLANAEKRLAKATGTYEAESEKKAQADEIAEIGNAWVSAVRKSAEEREAEYQKWLKEFKARCAKDGVLIDEAEYHRVIGKTAKGKGFAMEINNGVTERSWHCYSLWIEGNDGLWNQVFTSGDFGTAYRVVKAR